MTARSLEGSDGHLGADASVGEGRILGYPFNRVLVGRYIRGLPLDSMATISTVRDGHGGMLAIDSVDYLVRVMSLRDGNGPEFKP